MHDSLRFKTIESSVWVVKELYRRSGNLRSFFKCVVAVSLPGLDVVEDGEVALYVTCLSDQPHSFELANGDRVYRTSARLQPEGSSFPVDVIIRSRQADTACATISVSEEVETAIKELL